MVYWTRWSDLNVGFSYLLRWQRKNPPQLCTWGSALWQPSQPQTSSTIVPVLLFRTLLQVQRDAIKGYRSFSITICCNLLCFSEWTFARCHFTGTSETAVSAAWAFCLLLKGLQHGLEINSLFCGNEGAEKREKNYWMAKKILKNVTEASIVVNNI